MFWKKKKQVTPEDNMISGNLKPVDIKVVIRTDLGNIRTNNEDAASFFRVADEGNRKDKGYLLIVADGMGGHQAGEVASRMAVDIIGAEYYAAERERNIETALSKAFNTANKKIFEQASSNEAQKGMGTTATALVIAGGKIFFAHAGDSRAYHYGNKKISRITQDHTYVQELVNSGSISAAEAETHPQRNILTNAMGTKPALKVDTGMFSIIFGEQDRLLLCSDGLYDYLTDEELGSVLSSGTIQQVADYLVDEAKRRGGKDNITVVLAEHTGAQKEIQVKSTRDIETPKLTRDAYIPGGLNDDNNDR